MALRWAGERRVGPLHSVPYAWHTVGGRSRGMDRVHCTSGRGLGRCIGGGLLCPLKPPTRLPLWLLLIVGPATVTLLKGQYIVFVLGWLMLGPVWSVACFRLAKPDSYWARHYYGAAKRARSQRRFET